MVAITPAVRTVGKRSATTHDAEAGPSMPRPFQFGLLLFVISTGALPQIIQGATLGLIGGGEAQFSVALISGLLVDLTRVAPVIVLSRHRAGILHPLILVIVLWPFLSGLPALIDNYLGYSGLIAGERLAAPYFTALGWLPADEAWSNVAKYNMLQLVSLLSTYSGYAMARQLPARRIAFLAAPDTIRLRKVLIGTILANFIGIMIFIQLRGGLDEHLANLSLGRFRALAGLGPLLALFDLAYLAMLMWTAYRPQDARHPLYIVMLVLVIIQQFITAAARSAAVLVVVTVGLTWSLTMRRLPWRIALIALPIVFLSFGVLNLVRSAGWTGGTATAAVQAATLDDALERSQQEFAMRQSLSGTIPVVVDGMRVTGGPLWGSTYAAALFAMVPRAVWPTKPRGPGSIYAVHFLGQSEDGTAVPIGSVSEAFWNFHLPGVILLFALFGRFVRRFHEFYVANEGNGLATTLFVLFVTLAGVSTDQLVAFQQSMVTIGVLLLIIVIAMPNSRLRDRLPQPAAA